MADIMENEDLRMLRIEQVMDLFPLSRVTVYRLIKSGEFPAPVKIGRVNLWRYVDLRRWLESRPKPKVRRGAHLI